MKRPKTIFVKHTVLLHHPRNMRRVYAEADVAEMADSIRACAGVEQALLVVPVPGRRGKYYVVDGNVRLEGARRLGPDAPLLKCEVRSQAEAEQLLTMAITNRFRFKVDPISEARHYQQLIKEKKYTTRSLSKAIGVSPKVISDLLLLLKLPGPVQQMIAEGQIPKDPRVARALLVLPAPASAKLAERMRGATVAAITHAAIKLKETLDMEKPACRQQVRRSRAICLARQGKARRAAGDPPGPYQSTREPAGGQKMAWPLIRESAQKACGACDIMAESLAGNSEQPAWALISHLAEDVCGDCPLAVISASCSACGLVDLLRRLVRAVQKVEAHAAPS